MTALASHNAELILPIHLVPVNKIQECDDLLTWELPTAIVWLSQFGDSIWRVCTKNRADRLSEMIRSKKLDDQWIVKADEEVLEKKMVGARGFEPLPLH